MKHVPFHWRRIQQWLSRKKSSMHGARNKIHRTRTGKLTCLDETTGSGEGQESLEELPRTNAVTGDGVGGWGRQKQGREGVTVKGAGREGGGNKASKASRGKARSCSVVSPFWSRIPCPEDGTTGEAAGIMLWPARKGDHDLTAMAVMRA